jgi:hypothetical protein
MPKETSYVVSLMPHSSNVQNLIGQNAIYVHPSCGRFLREHSNVVDITI